MAVMCTVGGVVLFDEFCIWCAERGIEETEEDREEDAEYAAAEAKAREAAAAKAAAEHQAKQKMIEADAGQQAANKEADAISKYHGI